jgi:hypothetical protein
MSLRQRFLKTTSLAAVIAASSALAGGPAFSAQHPAAAASAASAGSLCVGSKAGCFPTIQAAVDAAHDGDTILIGAGTFAGGVTIDVSVRSRRRRRGLGAPAVAFIPFVGLWIVVFRSIGWTGWRLGVLVGLVVLTPYIGLFVTSWAGVQVPAVHRRSRWWIALLAGQNQTGHHTPIPLPKRDRLPQRRKLPSSQPGAWRVSGSATCLWRSRCRIRYPYEGSNPSSRERASTSYTRPMPLESVALIPRCAECEARWLPADAEVGRHG